MSVHDPQAGSPRQAMAARLAQIRTTGTKSAESLLSAPGLRGTAVEFAWQSMHLALYPFGLGRERLHAQPGHLRLDSLPPVQRGLLVGDVEAAGTPIVLIHGVVDNRTVFTVLRRGLRRRGFGRTYTVNYSPLSDDIRRVAQRLSDAIEGIVYSTGYERVHVVGHSMGGLIGRYYVQRMGGHSRVHTLVTLGSPHLGTAPARLVPHPIARQMRPDSAVLAELAEPAPGCTTRMVSIWSDLDQMVIPKRNARIEHPDLLVRNILVRGVGHLSFPVDKRVVHTIGTTLAHLDHEGHALVARQLGAQRPTARASAPARSEAASA